MIRRLLCIFSLIGSLAVSAILVENQSNGDVIFKTMEATIVIEPDCCAEISLAIMNQFHFLCVGGGASLYQLALMHTPDESNASFVNENEYGLISTDKKLILFKLEIEGKLGEFSCYEKMIIKKADPNIYDGISIMFERHTLQKIKDAVDISAWKCNIL